MTGMGAFVPARKVYIGVDPGVNTGLAVVAGREFVLLETTTFWGAYQTICESYPPFMVARVDVEIAKTSHTWHLKNDPDMTIEKAAAIGQKVGSARRDGQLMVAGLQLAGYKVIAQAPLGVGKDERMFRRITGLRGKLNEHVRDAAVMAYTRANGA